MQASKTNSEQTFDEIRYMQMSDKSFWLSLDKHLPEREYENKVRSRQGYVLIKERQIRKGRQREISAVAHIKN